MEGEIRLVAVLGAGTMGAQIAAHVANAGLPVVLLDLTADAAVRGLERLSKTRPDPLFTPDSARLITTASLDDLSAIAGADWVVEAVVEQLDVKRDLLARVERHASSTAILSSNTSGIPLSDIAATRPLAVRRRWLGTHFFNPPRYLRLVELISTPDTDAGVSRRMGEFLDYRLGKGVVAAHDTPGFIANRIGMFGVMRVLELVSSGEFSDFSINEIDALTGPLIGRPKSATFRTIDIAGLDILAIVADDLARRLPESERGQFSAPPLVRRMVERGLVGVKTGQGFYKRVKPDGDSTILTIDPATLEYRAAADTKLPGLEPVKSQVDVAARLRTLFLRQDRAGDLLRRTLGPTLLYAARIASDVADSIDDVDRAMRWGFGWELGPFETWDAIGVRAVLDACGVSAPPTLVQQVLDAGRDRFRDHALPPAAPGLQILRSARERSNVVRTNAGASLVDLGDDVLCVEFHSKLNAIGGDTIAMIETGVKEAAAGFAALVVGCEAEHFSAGANLMLLLLEAQEGNWDEVDAMVRAFQRATMALKTSPVPVVIAPAGLALGGGCEICLHGDRIEAAAETYMGLVEVGVGLIPAGGGTKELLIRAVDRAGAGDTFAHVQAAFETIGFAKVSTSGPHARQLGYLRDVDHVTMNRERVIAAAKTRALGRVAEGYTPPARRTAVRVGGATHLATLSLGVHLAHRAGRISDHDALIGRKLASILAGGDLPHATTVSEDYLLDLEREAFLSLCGERKTQERIGYTLKTGKTLRN
jgi:3-hydroxyacyl-CoA dehydrogenase